VCGRSLDGHRSRPVGFDGDIVGSCLQEEAVGALRRRTGDLAGDRTDGDKQRGALGQGPIDGNRVVFYPWQVFPDPTGGDAVYRFGCITILEYAGEGLWSYQEDVYNPREGEDVVKRWLEAGGQLPAPG